MGLSSMSVEIRWLQAILWICSRRRSTLNVFFCPCFRIFMSPMPLSFHCLESLSNLYTLALCLKSTSSSSSPVVTLTSSGRGMIGSK